MKFISDMEMWREGGKIENVSSTKWMNKGALVAQAAQVLQLII